jgi:hypothetical protein
MHEVSLRCGDDLSDPLAANLQIETTTRWAVQLQRYEGDVVFGNRVRERSGERSGNGERKARRPKRAQHGQHRPLTAIQ